MAKLTPMMAQYKRIKEQYQDAILMFRMGDFYEMFFEDAVEASQILQIALTARNKGSESKAEMCGVPYHAVDQYLAKLTRAGKKVAICDQLTEPDGKNLVERDVVRVVTPGTTFDDGILEGKANNYVASIVYFGGRYALAYCDVTTGEFRVSDFAEYSEFRAELLRVRPAECVFEESARDIAEFNNVLETLKDTAKFPYSPQSIAGETEELLREHFEVQSLKVFGLEGKPLAVSAAGMLLEYLKDTQKTDLKHILKISYYEVSDFMPLDEACIRNLELFFTNFDGKKEGSLVWVLDQTKTAMGGRLLRNWVLHPLLEKNEIDARLDKVGIFVGDSILMREVRDRLGKIFDIERLLSRLSLGTGNARDLVALKQSLDEVPGLKSLLGEISAPSAGSLGGSLHSMEELRALIGRAIKEDPPMIVREGGIIADGYNEELDELRSISTEGKTFIKDMQEREIKKTGISSLKIKYNKVFGYYIEISKSNLDAVPDDYIRKQTLVNAERFITPELKDYEDKVLSAEDRIKELEYELFYEVRMEVVKEIVRLQEVARAVAEIDVLSDFAFVAERNRYCRPEITLNSDLKVANGRHPVVEQMGLSRDFVPNDCEMSSESPDTKRFLLITGPNMGGKSTYLRQVALISLMAQIGCYVPADSARLGVLDRVFTRVGASDNLVRGESTFMVEMQEASYILNNASERSLIILDEIGRGTSTYDGVSIAWAITEFIHDKIGAKTLFATHYHELTQLAERLRAAKNMSVAVRENEVEGVVFLYKIVDGAVDKSYGIEVAKLAGLPVEIVSRARGVLDDLENKRIKKDIQNKDQIDMFARREHKKIDESKVRLLSELKELDINKLTPLEALQKLNELKDKSNVDN